MAIIYDDDYYLDIKNYIGYEEDYDHTYNYYHKRNRGNFLMENRIYYILLDIQNNSEQITTYLNVRYFWNKLIKDNSNMVNVVDEDTDEEEEEKDDDNDIYTMILYDNNYINDLIKYLSSLSLQDFDFVKDSSAKEIYPKKYVLYDTWKDDIAILINDLNYTIQQNENN